MSDSLFPPPRLLFRQTRHDAKFGLLQVTSLCASTQDEGSYWLEQEFRNTAADQPGVHFKLPEGTERVYLDAETLARLLPHLVAIVEGG